MPDDQPSGKRTFRLAARAGLLILLLAAGAGTFLVARAATFTDQASVPGNTFTTAACFAGNTGFLSPTAEAADTGGDNDGFELNPTNAFADDAAFASNINGAGDRHRFYNYGISMGTCAIRGIEVRLDWWLSTTLDTNSMSAELSWDAGGSWTAAKTDTQETTSEHTVILGGSTDTWGRSWTVSELSDANFRVRITSNCSGSFCSFRDYYLDWVPVKVYYGPP